MAIQADSTILETDFIQKADRNATKSNDAGRVPQLESDGYLDPEFLKDVSARLRLSGDYSYPADEANNDIGLDWDTEDFDTSSLHGTAEETMYNVTTEDASESISATTTWFAQEFATGASQRTISRIVLYGAGSGDGSDTVVVSIRSSLTGADLVEGETRSIGAGANQTFYFPDYKLDPSTTYYLIVRTTSLNGSFNLKKYNSGSGFQSSTNSGSSWTPQAYGMTVSIYTDTRHYFKIPEAGKYLVAFNFESGGNNDYTIKIKANNTTLAIRRVENSGSTATGGSLFVIYSFSANDIVYATSTGSTEADGTTFEIFRLR